VENKTAETSAPLTLRMPRKVFQAEVERMAQSNGSYIDAIFTVCERNDIEVEAVSFYVTGALKERVTLEAKQKFLLRRELCLDQAVELPL